MLYKQCSCYSQLKTRTTQHSIICFYHKSTVCRCAALSLQQQILTWFTPWEVICIVSDTENTYTNFKTLNVLLLGRMHLTNPSSNYHTNEAVQHLPQHRLLISTVDLPFFPERLNKSELLPMHCKRTTNTLTPWDRNNLLSYLMFLLHCTDCEIIGTLKRVTYMLVMLHVASHRCQQDVHIYFIEILNALSFAVGFMSSE